MLILICYNQTMKSLNGAELASFIKQRQAKQVRMLRQAHHIQPRLAIVTDSDNPVIATYMRLKQRYGADILIEVEICRVATHQLLETITVLNQRDDVQGIIVQLPLAEPEQTEQIVRLVAPEKDVDGLNSERTLFDPATPMAINWLLAGYSVELAGKKLAIVGRGRLVGAPLERMWRASARDIRSGMADGNTDTDARQTARRRTVGQIRTADRKAQIGEHFRDTAHPGTADANKMNVFNLMPHAVLRRWPV